MTNTDSIKTSVGDLNPCPFCGQPVEEIFFTVDYFAFVKCRNCGCSGPEVQKHEVDGSVYVAAGAAWNKCSLRAALAGLLPFVLESYYPSCATPKFKAAVEAAQAAIKP